MQQIKGESLDDESRKRPSADVGNPNVAAPLNKSRSERHCKLLTSQHRTDSRAAGSAGQLQATPGSTAPLHIGARTSPYALSSPNRICLLGKLQLSFFYDLGEGHSLLSPFDAASRAKVTSV
jgi:hypothetical protein